MADRCNFVKIVSSGRLWYNWRWIFGFYHQTVRCAVLTSTNTVRAANETQVHNDCRLLNNGYGNDTPKHSKDKSAHKDIPCSIAKDVHIRQQTICANNKWITGSLKDSKSRRMYLRTLCTTLMVDCMIGLSTPDCSTKVPSCLTIFVK
jgi:hypothetical protein